MSEHILKRRAAIRGALVPAVVLLAGGGVLAALSLLPRKKPPEASLQIPAVNVTVREIVLMPRLQDDFWLKGTVEPWATIHLSAETSGRIEKIDASEGDLIRPNQPLIHLEEDLLEAGFQQAKVKADFDARELQRKLLAEQRHVATAMEVDAARSAAKGSAAVRDFAAAQLRRAVISAPARVHDAGGPAEELGVLNHLAVEVGEYVDPGARVAEIVYTHLVKVLVDVPEGDIRYLEVGQELDVEIGALDGRVVRGVIHFIKATADKRTLTFGVEIRVSNPTRDIRAGMIVRVRLVRRELHDVIMIPLDSIIPLEAGYEVYVSNDGKAERRMVSIGLIRGRQVQALSPPAGQGLSRGDRLIVKGQRLIGDGQRIMEQPDPQQLLRQAVASPSTSGSQPVSPATGEPAGSNAAQE